MFVDFSPSQMSLISSHNQPELGLEFPLLIVPDLEEQ